MTTTHDPKDLMRDTLNASRMILTLLSENFENPVDAYVAMVLTLASLSHGLDIDLDHTVRGVTTAYNDLNNKKDKVMQ